MPRVAGKIALVTGAASQPGLGSATAHRLAEEGASVFLTDIDLDGAESVAAAIRAAGGDATALIQNVTIEAEWERVFTTIINKHERVDILVNNAGIAVLGPIEAMKAQDWAKQIEVNLTSVFLGTRRAVAAMRKTGGSIINMASVAGNVVGVPGGSVYSASKGGVRAFSKSIAIETARDRIRVNSIHPGLIRTNIHSASLRDIPGYFEAMTGSIPMGFMGDPADIANCVLFLASDEARYITGAEFVVDGGFSAQ
jgi:NAD(P)-dependent dehydrogenase (short-subunit alcohol dehydrogenase family)